MNAPVGRSGGVRRIKGAGRLDADLRGGVVAIGNFDGIHRGHQAVLSRALSQARTIGAPALMLTFEPHPRRLFQPDLRLPRLTPAPLKAAIAGALGIDAVVEQPFTQDFAELGAEAFIDDILVGALAARHVVTGVDFHFGRGREGGPAFLMEAGRRHGFGVTLIDPLRDEGAEIISSSRIRALLGEGRLGEANALLGYRHVVEAEVVPGKRLGRSLGYPTANMALGEEAALAPGIYAVRFRRADGRLMDGVASFGRRPTVEEAGAMLLETFIFDFSSDLYGETCRVFLFAFLRGEKKFPDIDALVARMQQDEMEARRHLAGVMPLSALDALLAFS